MKHPIKTLFALSSLALIFLASCGGGAQPSPTTDVNGVYTQAAATAFAQLTQTALAAPSTATFTNTPEATATLEVTNTSAVSITATPTLTSTPIKTVAPVGEMCEDSAYLKDVTYPDGSSVFPGQKFKKTWLVKNTGSCTWTSAFTVVYAYSSDNWIEIKKYPPAPAEIGITVAVGAQAEVSIMLNAPIYSGEYYGVFRLANAKGYPFGTWLSVLIEVSGTPVPTKKP
jgi:hypothetical protein